MKTVRDRLEWFLNHKGLSKYAFAKKIKYQSSSMSHIFSGRNKPSISMITAIGNAFPELSMDWFILGNGEPFKDEQSMEKLSSANRESLLQVEEFTPIKPSTDSFEGSSTEQNSPTLLKTDSPEKVVSNNKEQILQKVILIDDQGLAHIHPVVN